ANSKEKLALDSLCYLQWQEYAGNPVHQQTRMHSNGLAGVTQRRANGPLTADDQPIREQILVDSCQPRIAENNMATKQNCFVWGFIDAFSGMRVSQPSVGHLDNVVVSE